MGLYCGIPLGVLVIAFAFIKLGGGGVFESLLVSVQEVPPGTDWAAFYRAKQRRPNKTAGRILWIVFGVLVGLGLVAGLVYFIS